VEQRAGSLSGGYSEPARRLPGRLKGRAMHDEVYCVFVIVICLTALAMPDDVGLIAVAVFGFALALAARCSDAVSASEERVGHDLQGR
jgi:hypothetical protein